MKLSRMDLFSWFNSTDPKDCKIVQHILDMQDDNEVLKMDNEAKQDDINARNEQLKHYLDQLAKIKKWYDKQHDWQGVVSWQILKEILESKE